MKTKGTFWLLVIFALIAFVLLFAYLTGCKIEREFHNALTKYGAQCSRARYINLIHGRTADQYVIINKAKTHDTFFHFWLCSESYKATWITKRYEDNDFFVLYTDSMDSVLPIWTYKSYLLFKKHFPDSAKLVDTTLFY